LMKAIGSVLAMLVNSMSGAPYSIWVGPLY
jgi:hypothetical protein